MRPSSSKALLMQLYNAFNAREINDLDRLLGERFVDRTPGLGQRTGIDGIKDVWRQIWERYPDVQITVEDLLEDGDRAAARLTFRYTDLSREMKTGIGFEIFRVADGKVVELWNTLRLG